MSVADASLAGDDIASLNRCIRLSLDCADRCFEAASLSAAQADAEGLFRLLEITRVACEACAAECRRHAARYEHCRTCADACDICAVSCRNAAASVSALPRAAEVEA